MDLLSCNSSLMLEKSLGFLWTKQAAILDNIANAETPNYREKIVTFEESLRGKLQQAARTQTPVKDVRRVLDSSPFAVTEQAVVTRMDENGRSERRGHPQRLSAPLRHEQHQQRPDFAAHRRPGSVKRFA